MKEATAARQARPIVTPRPKPRPVVTGNPEEDMREMAATAKRIGSLLPSVPTGQLQPTSGRPTQASNFSASTAAATYRQPSSNLLIWSQIENGQLVMQTPLGALSVPVDNSTALRDFRRQVMQTASRDPEATKRALEPYLPPPLVSALAGRKRTTTLPALEDGQIEIEALSTSLYSVRFRRLGYVAARTALSAIGIMGILATDESLAQEIAVGRAAFGQRAYAGVDSPAVAAAELEPWLAELHGFPRWIVKAAFVKANSKPHPPRPEEVSAICRQIGGDLGHTVKRLAVAVLECETKRPDWKEEGKGE